MRVIPLEIGKPNITSAECEKHFIEKYIEPYEIQESLLSFLDLSNYVYHANFLICRRIIISSSRGEKDPEDIMKVIF